MPVAERGALFVASCLVLGLGLFFCAWGYHAAGAIQGFYHNPVLDAIGLRSLAVLAGLIAVAAGAYGAWVAMPL